MTKPVIFGTFRTNKTKGVINMEQITISKDEYAKLVKHQLFADAVKNILATKAKEKQGIFSDEVKLICKMFGIEVDSE